LHLYFLFLFFGLKYEEEEFSFKLHDLDFIIGFDFFSYIMATSFIGEDAGVPGENH
jgi:hypothetical protein